MKTSRYFAELLTRYDDEIDDLLSDSEGKSVLQKRLNDKRKVLPALLPMIEFSPEMVAVVFYNAFSFKNPRNVSLLVHSAPGQPGFARWTELKPELGVTAWAEPLLAAALKADGGEDFVVTTVGLEYLRTHAHSQSAGTQEPAPETRTSRMNSDGDDQDEEEDLGEAGADWLVEQGFDALEK